MSDLRKLARRAIQHTVATEGRPGLLGKKDGTLAYTDPGGAVRYDRCWARVGNGDAQTELVVRCTGVPRQLNLPVLIADRNGVPTAIRVDYARAETFAAGYLTETPTHSWVHSRLGLDPIYIASLAFLPLMAVPTSPVSMMVEVQQAFYRYEGTHKVWETANSADLSAYLPAPNIQHFIILCLDRANNALAVVDGSDVPAGETGTIPFTVDDVAAISIPAAYWPICAIRFYNGQTAIEALDIFMDLRLWGGEHLGPGGVATHNLFSASHPDVDIAVAPTDGQALVWDELSSMFVPGDAAIESLVLQEDHSGECNGSRTAFATTVAFEPGTTLVWLNGLLQRPGTGNDYTEDGDGEGITFTSAPEAGDTLLLAYVRSTGTAVALSGPYVPAWGDLPELLLVQLHAHTDQSDGDYTPAEVVAYYDGEGYDGLVITDHDLVTSQPAGLTVAPEGNELSPATGHILSLDCDYTRGAETDRQTLITAVVAAGGQAVLAHPAWYIGFTYAQMAALTGYLGIEIHNAICMDGAGQNPITYPGFDVEDWDSLLTNVSRAIWGFASDDFHDITALHGYNVGRIIAFCSAATMEALLASLVAGNFCADVSNFGVTPGRPVVTRRGVSLTCPGATSIRFIGDGGALLSEVAGDSAAYEFAVGDTYVRIEAVGDYTEAFGSAIDTTNRWGVDGGTWVVSGGILSQSNTADAQYLLILKRHICGDIDAKIDIRLLASNSQQAGLLLNVLDTTRFYFLRLANGSPALSPNTLSLWLFNGGSNSELDSAAYTPSADTWYRVRCVYTHATGRFQARVWAVGDSEPETWHIDVIDTTWKHGAVGLRVRQLADFDNLYVKGFKTYYQPIPVADWEV